MAQNPYSAFDDNPYKDDFTPRPRPRIDPNSPGMPAVPVPGGGITTPQYGQPGYSDQGGEVVPKYKPGYGPANPGEDQRRMGQNTGSSSDSETTADATPPPPPDGAGTNSAGPPPPVKAARDLTNQRQTMDDWLGHVQANYGTGASQRGNGFWGGGLSYKDQGKLQGVVDSFNQANGTQARAVSGDKVDFGDGRGPIDVITSEGDWWFGGQAGGSNPEGGGGGGGTSQPATSNTSTGSNYQSSVSQPPTQTASSFGMNDPRSNALYEFLMQRAHQGLDVNASDPLIKNRVDAYNAQEQRAAKNYASQAAEKLGANANMDAELRSSSEKIGQDTAGFESTLMGQELSARRQEIQEALNGALGFLSEQQRMSLQQELGQLELAQKRYMFDAGQGQQESQFSRELAQRGSQFDRDLGQRGYEFDSNDQFRNSPLYG